MTAVAIIVLSVEGQGKLASAAASAAWQLHRQQVPAGCSSMNTPGSIKKEVVEVKMPQTTLVVQGHAHM